MLILTCDGLTFKAFFLKENKNRNIIQHSKLQLPPRTPGACQLSSQSQDSSHWLPEMVEEKVVEIKSQTRMSHSALIYISIRADLFIYLLGVKLTALLNPQHL